MGKRGPKAVPPPLPEEALSPDAAEAINRLRREVVREATAVLHYVGGPVHTPEREKLLRFVLEALQGAIRDLKASEKDFRRPTYGAHATGMRHHEE